MIWSGPVLPLVALAAPLALALLAAVPAVRPRALLVLPFAPIPAAMVALFGPRGETTVAFDLLLEVRLGLDETTAIFLGAAAVLWTLAGVYATASMGGTRKPATFAAFWCLTLVGNLGVFLARDAVTFYASFTAVSLPAYILIVHDATGKALRAGRIYMVLAIVGETALLSALLIGCAQAGSIIIADVKAALAASPERDLVTLLLVLGFGIKAGLVPLHLWLPLAHPEAPTPASAVLSGAIVKAGIVGLAAFVPAGPGLAGWSAGLVATGLFGAYYAVAAGLTQANPKVVLAYSTVSQMGLVIAAVGASLTANDPTPVLVAVALYSAHHGFAKGALFLSVGVMDHAAPGGRWWMFAAVAAVALSVAGLPFTGGAAAKAALKGAFEGAAALAVTLSATGTALLLLRFFIVLRRRAPDVGGGLPVRLSLPVLACIAMALLLPWALLPPTGLTFKYIVAPATLWSTTWPILLAVAIALASLVLKPRAPKTPPGDLVVLAERCANWRPPIPRLMVRLHLPLLRLYPERVERVLLKWQVAGGLVIALAIGSSLLLR